MTQIQLRRGTAGEWSAANPILASGEFGVDLTNNQFRIGDGIKTWSALPVWAVVAGGSGNAVVLVYSGGAYPARPAGLAAGLATYKGPTQPTTWLTGDTWMVVV